MRFLQILEAEISKIIKKKVFKVLLICALINIILMVLVVEFLCFKYPNLRHGTYNPDIKETIRQSEGEHSGLEGKLENENINIPDKLAIEIALKKLDEEEKELNESGKSANIIQIAQKNKRLRKIKEQRALLLHAKEKDIPLKELRRYQESGIDVLILEATLNSNKTIKRETTSINIISIIRIMFVFVSLLVMMISVLMVSNSFASEVQSGEMRLISLRPVTRMNIVRAKFLSVIIVNLFVVLGMYAASCIYGATFQLTAYDVYSVVANKAVTFTPFIQGILPLVEIVSMVLFISLFSMSLAVLAPKSKFLSVRLPIAIIFVGQLLKLMLGLIGADVGDIYTSLHFMDTLKYGSIVDGDFISALIFYIIHILVFLVIIRARIEKIDFA